MCLGIPAEVVEVLDAGSHLALVDVNGVRRSVSLACIVTDTRPVSDCVGEWVLVHAGFAMSIIDEAEAARTLALLAEMAELQSEFEAIRASAHP